MPVRQVQAHEVPRHHLREVRRRGDAHQGAPRAHGPYRARLAGGAHLVPEVAAEPHRAAARHDAARPRAHPLFRELRGHRARPDAAQVPRAAERGAVPQRARRVRRRSVPRRHRRRGDPRHAAGHRPQRGAAAPARGAARDDLGGQAQEAGEAPQALRKLHRIRRPSGVDDPRAGAGDPARAAPAGAARRRPLRHLGPQRPLPPRHQPQQPAEAADRAARARHHRAQREAHAAGVGRRAVRQRPPRPRHHRRQQASAEVARPTC
mgnify:CR=1 FL=1